MRRLPVSVVALALVACHQQPAKRSPNPPPRASAASAAAPETVTFTLHKFLQRIGVERDTYTPVADGSVEAKAAFAFQDRSTPVPLAAVYELGSDGLPRRYQAWGKTSRAAALDDRVVRESDGSFTVRRLGQVDKRRTVRHPFAAASGYGPVLGQQLLVRAWLKGNRPAEMDLLPEGRVRVESRGRETFTLDGKPITFEHVAVHGLVWGREDVWLDDAGNLAAVVTRDAEFDPFEAVRENYGPLVGELTKRAGADAVASLADVGKQADKSPAANVVALVGGRLIDGTGRPPVDDATVIYSGDRIVSAGPRATTPIPAGAATVDAQHKTILPGLWDMHAHYAQVEQGAFYLAAGVTTARDVGNILEFITAVRDVIDAGRGLGPRLLVDGLVDGDGRMTLGTLRIDKPEDIGPVLDRLQRAGCPEVKIYSSLQPALVKPLAAEAHRRGLRVTGHVPERMSIIEAIDAGFDAVNHIQYVVNATFPREEREKLTPHERRKRIATLDLRSPEMQRVFAKFVEKKIVLDPTVALFELFLHTAAENARREPGLAKLPRELEGMFEGSPAEDAEENEAVFRKYLEVLGEIHRRGIPIVAGTDIGVPGHSLHRELELYVQAGLTPMEAIQSATIVPARVMRRDKEVGTIEPGKRADLVLVAGNPLANIHDIRNVSSVIARGRMYDSAALWRLVGFEP